MLSLELAATFQTDNILTSVHKREEQGSCKVNLNLQHFLLTYWWDERLLKYKTTSKYIIFVSCWVFSLIILYFSSILANNSTNCKYFLTKY